MRKKTSKKATKTRWTTFLFRLYSVPLVCTEWNRIAWKLESERWPNKKMLSPPPSHSMHKLYTAMTKIYSTWTYMVKLESSRLIFFLAKPFFFFFFHRGFFFVSPFSFRFEPQILQIGLDRLFRHRNRVASIANSLFPITIWVPVALKCIMCAQLVWLRKLL